MKMVVKSCTNTTTRMCNNIVKRFDKRGETTGYMYCFNNLQNTASYRGLVLFESQPGLTDD